MTDLFVINLGVIFIKLQIPTNLSQLVIIIIIVKQKEHIKIYILQYELCITLQTSQIILTPIQFFH